jgi:hypothetical protein
MRNEKILYKESGSGYGPVTGSSGNIKGLNKRRETLGQLSDYQFLQNDFPWS